MNLPPYESVGWTLAEEKAYLPRGDVPSPPGMSWNTVHTVTVGGELLMRWYYHDTDVTFR